MLSPLHAKPEDEEWTVPNLRQSLGKCISAMEMAGNESSDVTVSSDHNNSHSTHQRTQPQLKATTGSLFTGNGSRGPSLQRQIQARCVYCNQTHWSDECPKYSTL